MKDECLFPLCYGTWTQFLCPLAHAPETPWGGSLAQLLTVRAHPQGRQVLLAPLPTQRPREAQVGRSLNHSLSLFPCLDQLPQVEPLCGKRAGG